MNTISFIYRQRVAELWALGDLRALTVGASVKLEALLIATALGSLQVSILAISMFRLNGSKLGGGNHIADINHITIESA
ncbi:hypothetical protein EAF04_007091 [Stromatinia cepivora]|nr:hypothetical protein EAF04_007091 [Stromatinia cepivora]